MGRSTRSSPSRPAQQPAILREPIKNTRSTGTQTARLPGFSFSSCSSLSASQKNFRTAKKEAAPHSPSRRFSDTTLHRPRPASRAGKEKDPKLSAHRVKKKLELSP